MFYENRAGYFCFIIRYDMGVIYVLITVSIIIAIIFLLAFVFAVRDGQYDDSVTPSIRMLFEDKSANKNNSKPLDKS